LPQRKAEKQPVGDEPLTGSKNNQPHPCGNRAISDRSVCRRPAQALVFRSLLDLVTGRTFAFNMQSGFNAAVFFSFAFQILVVKFEAFALKRTKTNPILFQGVKLVQAPDRWTKSCAHDECTLHSTLTLHRQDKKQHCRRTCKKIFQAGRFGGRSVRRCPGRFPWNRRSKGERAFGADISP